MSPLFLIPLIYIASVLQIGLAPRWQIAGAGPDLLALIAVIWAIRSRGWHALVIAALLGLAGDLNSTTPLGIGIAVYAVTASAVIWWRRQIKLDGLAGQVAVVWASVTAITLLEFIASRCFGQSLPALHIAIERTAVIGVYTTMIAIPILLVMSWRCERQDPMMPLAAPQPRQ
jgi:rod shape-determining protein MreD